MMMMMIMIIIMMCTTIIQSHKPTQMSSSYTGDVLGTAGLGLINVFCVSQKAVPRFIFAITAVNVNRF